MKRLILQLFLNKHNVAKELQELQSKNHKDWNTELIDAKHAELDKYNHMIDLFFESINL